MNPIIASGGGPVVLGLYARGLSMIAGAAGFLVRNVPGATTALSALFAIMVLNKITGVGALAGWMWSLGGAIVGTTAFARLAAPAFWALNGALVATRAAAASAWLAITGPVGLVILGIALITAAVVTMYTQWGWFHRAVDNTWDFISSKWGLLAGILAAPFVPFLALVTAIAQAIGGIKAAGGWVGKVATAGPLGALIGGHAAGGVVRTPLQVMGEHGKELAAMPIGTRVISAPETRQMLRAPTMPRVSGAPSMAGAGGGTFVHRSYITVQVDRHVLGQVMDELVADELAAG